MLSTSSLKQASVPQAHADSPSLELIPGRKFRSYLTVGVLTSRWLRPYSTPCQGRGAMV